MASVNQTRPHWVNQMGKTHSEHLEAGHGNGMLCVNRPLEAKKWDLILLKDCEVLCSMMMKRDGCERLLLVLFCGGYTQVHGGIGESNSSLEHQA